MENVIAPQEYDVIITSHGGVGTTFFMNFLQKKIRINNPNNSDGFKHLPYPPFSLRKKKYIYIYGNPKNATLSLFRRKYHYPHSTKYDFLNICKKISDKETIEDYIIQGEDKFGLEQHFTNWLHKYPPYGTTLFVRYEKLHDNLDEIFEYLNFDKKDLCEFPKKKQRVSNESKLNKNLLPLFDKIYLNFENKLIKLDDCFIINNNIINLKALLHPSYLKVFLISLVFILKNKIIKS